MGRRVRLQNCNMFATFKVSGEKPLAVRSWVYFGRRLPCKTHVAVIPAPAFENTGAHSAKKCSFEVRRLQRHCMHLQFSFQGDPHDIACAVLT